MIYLWPDGDPIQVTTRPDGTPHTFYWRAAWHTVDAVANQWRVRATWWSEDAWREYYKLTTVDGLLCELYADLSTHAWFLSSLYD